MAYREVFIVMDDFRYDFGKLKQKAMFLGWPRSRVAAEAKVSTRTANKLFRGESVAVTTVKKIADALGVPMSEIVVPAGPEITVPAESALAERRTQ